ncbi:hypothetical protein CL617_05845 [archaeon]|nr:hypothetical protein [archaeon]|tara:strand:- start:15724 stop:16260 length:537 start_codon:yes stop_codon:yes gene_type:complete
MNSLIILAGLPAVGKSYTARLLKNKLKNSLYFDSDLFAKKYSEKNKFDFPNLSLKEQKKKRIIFHKAKVNAIKKELKKYDYIILDTCFDIVETRKLFYSLKNTKLIIIELKCSEKAVKGRIFNNPHESHRMVGDQKSRYKVYKNMKSNWKPIKKIDYTINTDKNVIKQIDNIVNSLLG